jgi:hypothetical protein
MPIQTVQQAISNESPNSSPFGFRNRIQNGEILVNQRANANTTNTASNLNGNWQVDRWQATHYNNSAGFNPNVSVKRTADHPIKGSAGYCLEIQCNSTATTANNVDFFAMVQKIESQNISDVFSGVNAQPMTLSFWVKSNKTGTYSVSLRDEQTPGAASYISIFSYTVNQVATWEKKVINIPKPTLSSLPSDNSAGLSIQFLYASGLTPTYAPGMAPAVGAWYDYGTNGAAVNGQANLFTNAGNYHRMTDVQLEVGTNATPFERRPFGVELQQCQRYFQYVRYYFEYAMGTVGNLAGPIIPFPVPLRAQPSFTHFGSTFGSNTTIQGPQAISTGAYYYAFLVAYASSTSGYGYRDVTYAVSAEI